MTVPLKNQAVCSSGEPTLNDDEEKIDQQQQVLVEVLVLTWVIKNLVNTRYLAYYIRTS